MILARADLTTKNPEKKQRFLDSYDIVESKFADIVAKDADRAFRPAINGNDIMELLGLPQGREVGYYMQNLTQASKDCEIGPSREDAIEYVLNLYHTRPYTP